MSPIHAKQPVFTESPLSPASVNFYIYIYIYMSIYDMFAFPNKQLPQDEGWCFQLNISMTCFHDIFPQHVDHICCQLNCLCAAACSWWRSWRRRMFRWSWLHLRLLRHRLGSNLFHLKCRGQYAFDVVYTSQFPDCWRQDLQPPIVPPRHSISRRRLIFCKRFYLRCQQSLQTRQQEVYTETSIVSSSHFAGIFWGIIFRFHLKCQQGL